MDFDIPHVIKNCNVFLEWRRILIWSVGRKM